jgi:hypothetical protein
MRTNKALLVLLLLIGGLPVIGQTAGGSSLNLGFVSPNTREGLKLEDAVAGLESAEESNLIKRVLELKCVVRRPIATRRAIGSWSDGAEPSLLIRVKTDESTMRYLMSRLGRMANQKAILYFHPQPKGNSKVYIIQPSKRFRAVATISRLLDSTGVAFRTLVPAKQMTTVYIVDTDNSLSARVRTATRRLRGKLIALTGTASFIGDDSVREKGQEIFQQEIVSFEAKHPNLPAACKSN